MRVTECCCGCSLKTGTIIIGYFHAITAFIAMSYCISVTYMAKTGMPPDYKKDEFKMLVFGIGSLVSLIQLAVSVCLTYGGYTGKRGFLVPWKVFAWIGFGLALVAMGLSFLSLFMVGDPTMLIGAAAQGIQAGLLWYCIAVVCSYGDSLVQRGGVIYVTKEEPRMIVNPVMNA